MRVLQICAGNLYGGIETMLVTLAREQPHTPEVEWTFALFFEGRFADELRNSGAAVHDLGGVRLSRPWTVLAARRRLRALLAAERWDAVVANGCWQHVIAAPVVRRAKVPLIYWAHGFDGERGLFSSLARRSPADLVIANSISTSAAVRTGLFPNAPCEIVHCPVARPSTDVRRGDKDAVRRELGVPLDAFVGVTTCRLEPWKGHELLLDALGRLRTNTDWHWWIVGGAQRPKEAEYLGRLEREALRLGLRDRIRFVGQRLDVPRILSAADIHCQPNTGVEPFGIAFVEALYAGLPVVTTALGGPLEILDETCGLLTVPGDADDLARALGRLIDDRELRQRLSAGGPLRAASLCDPVRQVERFAQILGRTFGYVDRTKR